MARAARLGEERVQAATQVGAPPVRGGPGAGARGFPGQRQRRGGRRPVGLGEHPLSYARRRTLYTVDQWLPLAESGAERKSNIIGAQKAMDIKLSNTIQVSNEILEVL